MDSGDWFWTGFVGGIFFSVAVLAVILWVTIQQHRQHDGLDGQARQEIRRRGRYCWAPDQYR